MSIRVRIGAGVSILCVLLVGVRPLLGDPPKDTAAHEGRKAVERALDFLQKDAAAWRKSRKCLPQKMGSWLPSRSGLVRLTDVDECVERCGRGAVDIRRIERGVPFRIG
jgi:hypothetical protein